LGCITDEYNLMSFDLDYHNMNSFDRIILIIAIITDIFLIFFISEHSVEFFLAMVELAISIGIICLIGWGVERLMFPRQKKSEITIERLDLDYQHLPTLNEWCLKHNLELSIAEKLDIIRSYKDKRLTFGSLKMTFIVNTAVLCLAAVTLIISKGDTIIRNLLESSASNSTASNLAQFQIQNLSNDTNIIIAIAILLLVTMILNLLCLFEAVEEQ
jgi:hypothetical protein